MGLGHGRTYDHLRTYLPEREIYVFDREVDCFDDCIPPDDRMLLGDIADTLSGRRHTLWWPGCVWRMPTWARTTKLTILR